MVILLVLGNHRINQWIYGCKYFQSHCGYIMLGHIIGLRMETTRIDQRLPSGKHTKNYRKSPFSMGKSTINGDFQ